MISRLVELKKYRIANSILWLAAAVFAFSRGVFEYFVGRGFAYSIQIAGISIIFLILIYRDYRRGVAPNKKWSRNCFRLSVLLLFVSCCSVVATSTLRQEVGLVFFGVVGFSIFLMMFVARQRFKSTFHQKTLIVGLSLLALFVALVGVFQQLGVFGQDLPGFTELFESVRPPSVTGSYLHYPLVISIGFCLAFIGWLDGSKLCLALACVLILAVFTSLSRSGMFISLGSYILLALSLSGSTGGKVLRYSIPILIVCAALILFGDQYLVIYDRLVSSLDSGSVGNDIRSELWAHGIALIRPHMIFYGSYFGLITNSASDAQRGIYGIVESSPIQMVLNIGLVGTLLFYGLISFPVIEFLRRQRQYAFVLIACLFQTTFYQSVEVIPFLFMLASVALVGWSADDVK